MKRYSFCLILLAVGLASYAAICLAQRVVFVGPPEANALKTVTFTFVKSGERPFPLGRFDGAKIVLERDDIKFLSSPISVIDDKGVCSFVNVPQGDYTLKIETLRLATRIQIRLTPDRKLFFDVNLGMGITIRQTAAHE